MQKKTMSILVLSLLLLVSLTGVAAADEQKINIMYVAFNPSDELEKASKTCVYSEFIKYTFVPGYNTTTGGASDELLSLAKDGVLENYDVIFCDMLSGTVYGEINNSLRSAHENGTSLLSIRSGGTPYYFDYISDGNANDTICNYYNNMGTDGKGLENAENLLIYLAKEYGNQPEITDSWGALTNDNDGFLFILGADFNKDELNSVSLDNRISSELNITIITKDESLSDGFQFSDYNVIFIESQDEFTLSNWTSGINAAKAAGSQVIGYNLSSSDSNLPNVDLYSEEYTDIERYWIQGGEENIKNMLIFMGQKFSDLWIGENIPEVEVIQEKLNITYIINSDTNRYFMKNVIKDRQVITDRFNIVVLSSSEAVNTINDLTDQDIVVLYMVGHQDYHEGGLKALLQAAKAAGVEIGQFAGAGDAEQTFVIDDEPYNIMKDYQRNNGFANMENWIRFTGNVIKNTYIEYSLPAPPAIPQHGLYHPDAFPLIFDNSAEYFAWYDQQGYYDPTAPTVGIVVGTLASDEIDWKTEDVMIRYLESKGMNVILGSARAFSHDVDYFVRDNETIVDVLISTKMFYLNFDYATSVSYLEAYNVPILKGVKDYNLCPDGYNASVRGISDSTTLASQVIQPEIEGLIDYIWIAGRTQDPVTERWYYEPVMEQVEWLCDRAISWAKLGHMDNSDKKVSIIYYNYGGGKADIGASYLNVPASLPLLLESMQASSYTVTGPIPNSTELIEMLKANRNVGNWAPGELDKVVNEGSVVLVPKDDYLVWYNELPASVRAEVEKTWGEAPGGLMVHEGSFVIPITEFGNVILVPQPMRGWHSEISILYHDKSIPPTHQYLATYFWINNVFEADAIIHFGTHGTQEWLPGKETGLWRYDYPSIMVGNTPVIYPYIVDNVGEGTQAKRRGNAVIIDHLIPPVSNAGFYGDLAVIHDRLHSYEDAIAANNTVLASSYRETVTEYYETLGFDTDLGVSVDELRNMNSSEFESFAKGELHDYLHRVGYSLMPMGLHIFGTPPEDMRLVTTVKAMLGNNFISNIEYHVDPSITCSEDRENQAHIYADAMLNETLLNSTSVEDAQQKVIGTVDQDITDNLHLGNTYAEKLNLATQEITNTLRALNAEYISPGPGNDPIRNPAAVPTGKNFYSFDQRAIPDPETQALGAVLAKEMLEDYKSKHGEYPRNVGFILWSVETMRHQGLMEAQIHALLGVEPVRQWGRLAGFEVIPTEDMTHPRIDVTIMPSGLYRDSYPYQLEMIDEAIRMVAVLNESAEDNYVRANSLKIENELLNAGFDPADAEYLSRARIFSEAPGSYGTGLSEAIDASDTWENEDELADLFISRMSNIYGKEIWGDSYESILRLNLMNIDSAIHSRSSNLYGHFDNDDVFSYLGGLGLAVRSVTGSNPEMYIAELQNPNDLRVVTLRESMRSELRSRYFNPKWIEGMMEHDYAGAREFMQFTEHMWGWNVVTPDLISDNDWNEIHSIYVEDKYDLGVTDFMKEANPHAYQSMVSRMIETSRKEYWDASDEVLQNLVKEYVESVVADGVTCCHHTCGNPLLDSYIRGVMTTTGVVDVSTAQEYERLMQEATHRSPSDPTSTPASSSRSSSIGEARVVESGSGSTNQTMMDDSGAGMDLESPATDALQATPNNYVEGYEMTSESVTQPESSSFSFSGSDVVATILVIAALGAIYIGFWRRRNV